MKTITIDSIGSTIAWNGPGTYVAVRMRGQIDYSKVPDGQTAQNDANTVVKLFASEPAAVQAPVRRAGFRFAKG